MPYSSAATLDSTTFVLMVDSDLLSAALERYRVQLRRADGVPAGRHPVCIDLWHVESGRAEGMGADQHEWSESSASTAGAIAGSWIGGAAASGMSALRGAIDGALTGTSLGPIASFWGAAAGWVAGGTRGAGEGALAGARGGAAMGAQAGRRWSESLSRSIGTYEEVLLAVPNAIGPTEQGQDCMFVLGMWANSAIAIWGDRALRCGYRKRFAQIWREEFLRYRVLCSGGSLRLAATFGPQPEESWTVPDSRLDRYRMLFAQPLLGILDDGTFAMTHLDRPLAASEVRWAPVSGHLQVVHDSIEGLPSGEFVIQALSSKHSWGAFQARHLVAKLTFPKHLSGGAPPRKHPA